MLILASNSPRRKQLLSWLDLPFEVCAADIDESPRAGEQPGLYTLRLAGEKAAAVAAQRPAGDLILASDTTVSIDGSILGKPADAEDAARMLSRLRGRTHQVYTAVALATAGGQEYTSLCTIDVPMRAYSADEMTAYIASGDPLDKAGAYAIQHAGFHPVEGMQGCFAGVMGLPLCHVRRLFEQAGVNLPVNIRARCLAELLYDCPVSF